jgi:predicted phosphoadenosine phosphosulfate sulfurtransferase
MLHLTINQPTTGIDVQTACDTFTWIDGVTYTESNSTATYTLTNAAGCDSVVTLNLTLNHAETAEIAETACGSFEWNGQTYTTSGDYTQTFTAANGCDSVVTLHLTINQPTTGIDVQTACESFTWIDGVTYTESNSTATYTLTNAVGCDSVVTLNLTLNHAETAEIAETACGSFEWNGQTYTTSGDYTQTFTAANGCDSVVTLHLTINQPTTGIDVQTACESFTWIDGVTYTESNSTATYTLTNAVGCDSVVTLNLTLNHAETAEIAETACVSYEWDGQTYTTSGDYTQTFTAANGCDSVVTLHLTINQPTTGVDVQMACDTFTWIDGVTYTESNNTATYTLTNAAGCDSVVTLNLTLNHAETAEIAETACVSFEWNGQTYTASGDYTQTFTNAAGCDSVVTLHLTIYPTETSEFSITTPDSCYIWNGISYCSSGDYTQTLQTVNGCDSIVTLHLTITVGVDDYDVFDFKVYPNPTAGVVNVQITNHNSPITEFHVYDAFGKLIRVVDAQTSQIDLSHYAAGTYFVKAVANGNVVAVKKVIKN